MKKIILTLIVVLLIGCQSPIVITPSDPKIDENTQSMRQVIDVTFNGIEKNLENIKKLSKDQLVFNECNQISLWMIQANSSLTNSLDLIDKKSEDLVKENAKLLSVNTILTKEKEDGTNKQMNLLIIASIIAMGVGAAVLAIGSRVIGIATIVGGGTTLGAALFVKALLPYALYIAIGVLILVVLGVVYVLFVKDRSAKETVKAIEVVKPDIPQDTWDKLANAFNVLQSNSTKKDVNKVTDKTKNSTVKTATN